MFSLRQPLGVVVRGRSEILKQVHLKSSRKLGSSAKMTDKFKLPAVYGTGSKSVWIEYNELIAEIKPRVNLGQGFPDYPPPQHVTDALVDVARGNTLLNQYTRGFNLTFRTLCSVRGRRKTDAAKRSKRQVITQCRQGHPRLVQNLSKLYSPLIGRELDPMNEILVGSGAYEALYSTIRGHVEKGDEVIVIEPFFDCYDVMIQCAGGIPRFIPLRPNEDTNNRTSAEWVLNKKELESLFNSRTKMIIVNTPHNPLGKVFTMAELQLIAELCKKHNVMCLSDEVYEWIVYEPHKHIRMATLPGMWERTITVGSAGKTFSVTGWKTGWAYGPAALIRNAQIVHQNCVYTCCTPIQEAVARAFEFELGRYNTPECYMFSLRRELRPKRDYLAKVLKDTGFKPTLPDGGYFIIADWTELENKLDLSTEKDQYKDYRFTKKLMKEVGVVAIPFTTFYSKEHKHLGENYARFCFIKQDEYLTLAEKLLNDWGKQCDKN